MTHICVGNLTIIGSDNGLSPVRRQAIIWTKAGILLIGLLGTNFSEIVIEILTFSFKKMRLKVSSAKWRPFCLGLNVLRKTMSWQTWMTSLNHNDWKHCDAGFRKRTRTYSNRRVSQRWNRSKRLFWYGLNSAFWMGVTENRVKNRHNKKICNYRKTRNCVKRSC